MEAKIFTAVTGPDSQEINQFAERIGNLQRTILKREGHQVPENDYPPEFNFTESLLLKSIRKPKVTILDFGVLNCTF